MNEKENLHNDEFEIDLGRMLRAILAKVWMVAIVSVLCAVLSFVVTYFFIDPEYESSAKFYVNNSSISVGDAALSISTGDISASKSLVDTYIVILKTRETLNDVIDYAGVQRSYREVLEMIQAQSVSDTEIFEVVVTSTDPAEAEKLANAIAYILPKRIAGIVEGTSAKIVESAVVASSPSSPSYTVNTFVGFALGMLLVVGAIVLRELFDTTVRTEEDITQNCSHPVLVSVPDMTAASKGGYDYSYDRKPKKAASSTRKTPVLMGSGMSFSASEAYKLLRTKLQFSFTDESGCRVIGVCSALPGEGKSLSAINLAYSLSQLNHKVLLIDCDMRRPTLAEKLSIAKNPGLSNYLTGQGELSKLLQYCGIPGDPESFHVLTAGPNPPNPVELLSSQRMEKLLLNLRKMYDYVIIDLPPVGEVSDAMAIARKMDGVLLVARQDHCTRPAFSNAVRQFEFVGARILGVVYNCVSESSGKYGKYGKYGQYGKYGHYKSYAKTHEAEARGQEQ